MKLFDSKKALALLLSLTLGFSFIPSVFATGELSETDEIIPSAEQVEQGTEALPTTDDFPEIKGANSYANEVNAYFTDGEIDLLDIIALRNYLANYDYDTGIPSGNIAIGADANGDGKISLLDLALLRQYLANYNYAEESSSIVLGKVNQ